MSTTAPHDHSAESFHQEHSASIKPSVETADDWRSAYTRKLGVSDMISVALAVVIAQLLRFRDGLDGLAISSFDLPYWLVGIALAITWWLALGWYDSRDVRVIGHGLEEAKRVVTATAVLFGVVAIFSYVTDTPTARGYLLIALPLGLLSLITGRWLLRRGLIRQRLRGKSTAKVLVVGDYASASLLVRNLRSSPAAGLLPVGLCLADSSPEQDDLDGLPLSALPVEVDQLMAQVSALSADTMVIASGSGFDPEQMRNLGWALAESRVRLILAPGLSDVAGPRIHTQPLDGLPLVHVSTPHLASGPRIAKRIADIIGSGLLLAGLSQIFLILALIIKNADKGPVFFRQTRAGLNGETFSMYKFRTMVVDAEAKLAALKEKAGDQANSVLFKMESDPRVTRPGQWMRRFSLDELPQLINVFKGEMSLVGPRPPLPAEVEQYEDHVHRRLLVKPGMTGLWQVSGRSDLSWEESVRLDLYYVENWSMIEDVTILIKTFRAVFKGGGAY